MDGTGIALLGAGAGLKGGAFRTFGVGEVVDSVGDGAHCAGRESGVDGDVGDLVDRLCHCVGEERRCHKGSEAYSSHNEDYSM